MGQIIRSGAWPETAQKIRPGFAFYRNNDGSALAAAAASGTFGVTSGGYGTGGTKLEGEAASGNTKTSTLKIPFTLPQNYVAASSLTLKVVHRTSAVANTTANIDAEAYRSDQHGGATGTDQIAAAPTTVNTVTWTTSSFTITGTSFSPGDEIDIYIRTSVDDSGGATGAKAQIGDVWLETTTRM